MKKTSKIAAALAVASAMGGAGFTSDACTRVMYQGEDSLFVIGRSLDWKTPIPTNIYVYPAGMHKMGDNVEGCVEWTSKYGAVYAVGYDGGVTEGMNEKGLVVNGLFCKGTIYNNPNTTDRPPISMAMFVAWMLDNFATTGELTAVLKQQNFRIGGATFDGGTVSTLHWGITDASGKTAYLEFDNGVVKIYDPGDIRALTNDPQWPAMEAIINYWDKIGGVHMLPGTVTSPDRAVRANYFAHHVKKTADVDLAVSIARSVLVPSCVPYTYEIETEPNVSSTQWRSYSVPAAGRYYFEIVTNPGYYYVDLNKCDLTSKGKVLKLDTSNTSNLVGDVTKKLKESKPFTPMY